MFQMKLISNVHRFALPLNKFHFFFVQLPPYNETVSCGIKSTGKFHDGKKSRFFFFLNFKVVTLS